MQHVHHNPLTSWAPLATFDAPENARRAKALLESNGFEVRLHDERWVQRVCFFLAPKAGVHLHVLKEVVLAARQCLDANPEVRRTMVCCPQCDSSDVQYPETTRKNILPVIISQILFLVRFMEPEHHCKHCRHTWPASRPGPVKGEVLKGAG
jgi:hypothetical protein